GTRGMLRADEWFPRRGRIAITITEPLAADGRDWSDAMALARGAREAILAHCGEPDLLAPDGSPP
ncbi:MAG TPA: hypothetical protein VKA14_02365, partial [Gammaproteobacteria bacterium]|nr:hypothetical protein [Gammaproteobacteria bacterium]